jgi:hypothetical protein
MPHSSTVNIPGWRAAARSATLAFLGVLSALVLVSFGSQVIVAPALLPAQWLIARHTGAATSMVFSVFGALLIAEVTWIALGLAYGESATPSVGGLIAAAGLGVGIVFFTTSRPDG